MALLLIGLTVIARRRSRATFSAMGSVRLADSRQPEALNPEAPGTRFNWVITSPPYYGMRTYIPDQWLRNWFVGGPDTVDYSNRHQIVHSSPEDFAADLRQVWRNAAAVCAEDARLVIRFGGLASKKADPLEIIQHSLKESGWRITAIYEAGSAASGRRQADTFLRARSRPMVEYDVWALMSA